jgi:hypothetical protein
MAAYKEAFEHVSFDEHDYYGFDLQCYKEILSEHHAEGATEDLGWDFEELCFQLDPKAYKDAQTMHSQVEESLKKF